MELIIEEVESRPGCWNTTVATLTHHDIELAKYKRNYGSYPHVILEYGENEWFLYHSPNSYMQWMVTHVRFLSSGCYEIHDKPLEALSIPFLYGREVDESKPWSNERWCFAQFKLNDTKQYLAVTGCFWGAQYDLLTWDISNPTEPHLVDNRSSWENLGPFEDVCFNMVGIEAFNGETYHMSYDMDNYAEEIGKYKWRSKDRDKEYVEEIYAYHSIHFTYNFRTKDQVLVSQAQIENPDYASYKIYPLDTPDEEMELSYEF